MSMADPTKHYRSSVMCDARLTPAAATLFGVERDDLSFPVAGSKNAEEMLAVYSTFFNASIRPVEHVTIKLQPRPDFSNLTELTLDLRRKTLHGSLVVLVW
jgi:hypothetical protein